MNNSKVKVLVVDDSAMFRRLVISGLAAKDNIEIVGEAADAFEARDKIMELKPDVLVMDIVMPKMDGLTFLKQLMAQYPVPCVMVSGSADEKQRSIPEPRILSPSPNPRQISVCSLLCSERR